MSATQPELLADWLTARIEGGDPSLPPPAGLDPEVVEAVDALRPDLVPLPDGGVEALLSALLSGPLAGLAGPDEHEAATAVARALDAGGPVDPDALGPDAYAALAALRPEAVPVPDLGVDDLFGPVPSVDARAASASSLAASVPSSLGQRAALPSPANRGRWLLPALSAVAMAAAVLVVVLPSSTGLLHQPDRFTAHVEFQEEPVAAAAPVDAAEPEDAGVPAVAAPAVVGPPTPAPSAKKAVPRTASRSAPPPAPAPERAPQPEPEPEPADLVGGPAAKETGALESATLSAGAAPEAVDLAMAEDEPGPTGPEGVGLAAEQPSAVPTAQPRTAPTRGRADRAQGTVSGVEAARSSLKRKRAQRKAEQAAGAPQERRGVRSAAQGLAQPARPTPRAPADVAAYGALDAALARGDRSAQRQALGTLGASSQPDVVADAHLQLARMAIEDGATGRALALLARALGTVGVSGPWRAQLFTLQGTVLEQRGDPVGAQQSYERAVEAR